LHELSFLRFPLCVIRSLRHDLLYLLVRKIYVRVPALYVSSSPVEQFLIVVALEVFAAKTVECSLHTFSPSQQFPQRLSLGPCILPLAEGSRKGTSSLLGLRLLVLG
jgi:hypothetical protein